MGNDGGSIPTRRELVKSAARAPTVSEMKATALESLAHAWSHDPLTSEPLDMENLVSDWRGRLYNYEAILKSLMPSEDGSNVDNSNQAPPTLVNAANGEWQELTFASTGIKSLRDVVKLTFKRYQPVGGKAKPVWACPLSLKELGPNAKAVYLVPCGHVFSDVAIKTVQGDICPECSEQVKAEDVIAILPTEKSDVERLSKRIEALRDQGLTHSLKKDKSRSKKKRKADDTVGEIGDSNTKEERRIPRPEQTKPPVTEVPGKSSKGSKVSGINNPLTASLTARVLAEQEERNKRRKLAAAR